MNDKLAASGRTVTPGDLYAVTVRRGKYQDGVPYQAGQEIQPAGDGSITHILEAFGVSAGGETINFKRLTDEALRKMEGGAAEGENVAEVSKDHFAGEYKLKPNIEYTINGYSYATNENGCIVRAAGNLVLGKGQRNKSHQIKAGGDNRLSTDHGGHLIAVIFDGSPLIDNIVAMDGKINLNAYKRLEREWKSALLQGEQVHVNIDVIYNGSSARPDAFIISYQVGKEMMLPVFLENAVGGK